MKEIRRKTDSSCEFHIFDFLGRNGGAFTAASHLGITEDEIKTVRSIPLSAYIRMGNIGKIRSYESLTGSEAELTVFFNYLAPFGVKGKNIITIYDMVCERFPETMQGRNRRLLQKYLKPCAKRADAIVTISEFSKREIMELIGIPEEKIFVAHCGVDTSYYRPASDENEALEDQKTVKDLTGGGRYILYVGTLEPRKNIKTLVRAFDIFCSGSGNEDTKLILAGGLGWQSEQTLEVIDASPFKDRIIRTGYISQQQKRALLRCAELFCFPSIYEGFGMPVTEAMACGTNAVIAETSSLPEASCGKAFAVDKDDAEGFAGVFGDILEGKKDLFGKEELITAVSGFTWERAAGVYTDAIRSCGVDFPHGA